MFRRQTKPLLWAGFGGLLLLMGVSGVSALSFLRQIQSRQDQIRRGFVDRNRLLESLRSDLYISGTYTRDFLLDGNESAPNGHLAPFYQTESRIRDTVAGYQKLLRPEETPSFRSFRQDLDRYLATLDSVAGWSPQRRRREGSHFVESELLPRRMAMVDLVGQIERLNERRLEASSQETSDLFQQFGFRLSILVVLTLGIGMLLAGASLWRILQLEKESETRFRRNRARQAGAPGALRQCSRNAGKRAAADLARAPRRSRTIVVGRDARNRQSLRSSQRRQPDGGAYGRSN